MRIIRISLVLGAVLGTPLLYALVRPEPRGFRPPKGTVAGPLDANELAGHYYKGDGTAYCDLDLNRDMSYRIEQMGCFGSDGLSVGEWTLTNSRVVFRPTKQSGVLDRSRAELSVLRFKQHWVLLPDSASAQQNYQKWGVSRFSCFQNTNFIFWGP